MSKIFVFSLTFLLFIIAAKNAYAVTVKITDYPQTITQDSFTITASVEGAQAGTNYLRVDLYREGTSSYFGETNNSADWYNGSDGKQYFSINIQSGQTWSGQVQARVENPPSSEYSGPGTYKIRIRRYTSSGNQGGEDANNSAVTTTIDIAAPSPAFSPSPSQTSTHSTSTSTKSPSPTPAKSPLSSPLKSPVAAPKTSPEILGESEASQVPSAQPSNTPSPTPKTESTKTTKVAVILTGSGVVIIGLCAVFFLWYRKVLENKEENKD